ncbi:MAG TPA: type II toxin-antitoxin system VapC family toxin [Chthoniobacterales bacterium]|nr:type II toxin-antitoxin system VapC family toxin [Chthoniobacterales bacterium]
MDTNAFSAFADADEALLSVLDGTEELFLPVIVLGEYRYGISSSRYRTRYQQWLARDLQLFRVLEIVESTTVHYATIRSLLKTQGTPIPANDCWIASLAKEYRLPVVSRDMHFDWVKGIRRIAW